MNGFTSKALLNKLQAKKKANGFTLIELMVVVAIVGVLTAVGLPQLTKAQDKAKDSAAVATLTNAAKECSLELIAGVDDYEFDADGPFADVGGTCAIDGTLTLVSESGAAGAGGEDGTTATVEFVGGVPNAVTLGATGG